MAPISLIDNVSTSTPAPTTLWDPYEVLDIYPNHPTFSCMGIAKYSNARCRWQFYDVSIRRAACARLDSIASTHPSKVTRRSLELVAEKVLCDNHVNQMYTKIAEWDKLIARHLNGAHARPPVAPDLGSERQLQSSEVLKREVESLRKELEKIKIERDNFRLDNKKYVTEATRFLSEKDKCKAECTEWKTKFETLSSQHDESLERFERVERRLKGKVRESEAATNVMKNEARAKLEEITSLIKQLTQSQTAESAKMEEIQDLKRSLADKDTAYQQLESYHSHIVTDLNQTLNDRDARIQDLSTANQTLTASLADKTKSDQETHSSQITTLTQTLNDRTARIEELERTCHNLTTQLSTLETTLADRDTHLATLTTHLHNHETTSQTLRDSRAEHKRRVSKLEQQNAKLRRQHYLAEFRHAVRLLVERRKVERVEGELGTAREREEGVRRGMEEEREGRRRVLAELKLEDVRRGVCAVVCTRPFRVSVRRGRKIWGGGGGSEGS